jgi:hypothetical protein
MVHLMIMTEIREMNTDLIVHEVALSLAEAEGATVNGSLMVDGKRIGRKGSLEAGEILQFKLPAPHTSRSLIEASVRGNRRVTWLARFTAPDWQVRNAAVADKKSHLIIGPMRNTFSKRREIVIAPMVPTVEPFLHRIRNAELVEVYPLNRGHKRLSIKVVEAAGQCELEIANVLLRPEVKGARSSEHKDDTLILRAKAGDSIEIEFG